MLERTFTLKASDGTEVFVYGWLPEGTPRGVVQVAHGLAEHGLRYRRFAEACVARGLAVYADDHRGHGRTAGDGTLGYFAAEHGWRTVLDDLYRLGDHITGQHPGVPRVFFGHSMGSFLAQQVMFERGDQLAGAVLSGSASGGSNPLAPVGRLVARVERARLGPKKPSAVLTKMTFADYNRAFAPARTEFDWLSRDPAEVDRYIADPRCGFEATTQLWVDLLGALPGLAAPSNLAQIPKDLPVYLTVGERDPLHRKLKDFHALVEGYERAGLRNVTVRVWPDARHEILNETNRDEVTEAVLHWVDHEALRIGR
jgi:alpha-beta hydrolase superfamily lysophospholipase